MGTQVAVTTKRHGGELYAVEIAFLDVSAVVHSAWPMLDLTIAVERGLASPGVFADDVASFLRAHMADSADMPAEGVFRVWPQSND